MDAPVRGFTREVQNSSPKVVQGPSLTAPLAGEAPHSISMHRSGEGSQRLVVRLSHCFFLSFVLTMVDSLRGAQSHPSCLRRHTTCTWPDRHQLPPHRQLSRPRVMSTMLQRIQRPIQPNSLSTPYSSAGGLRQIQGSSGNF